MSGRDMLGAPFVITLSDEDMRASRAASDLVFGGGASRPRPQRAATPADVREPTGGDTERLRLAQLRRQRKAARQAKGMAG